MESKSRRWRHHAWLAAGWIASAMCLGACGGSNDPPPNLQPPAAAVSNASLLQPASHRIPQIAAAAAPLPTATQLMDWAQTAYPYYFPGPQADINIAPYTFRYYPSTRNYLGVAGDTVYVQGEITGGQLVAVGTLSQFACNVFPDSCGTVFSAVTAHLYEPTSISAELANGGYMPNAYVSGYVTGNTQSLAGQTLYVIIEDPYGLYQTGVYPYVQGTSLTAALYGARQTRGGMKNGNLKIHVCLDNQCSTRLAGSPLLIPFIVDVGDGVTLDQNSVEVTASAYQTPTSASVQVTLPRYLQSWSVRTEPSTEASTATFLPSAVSSTPTSPTGTVVVNMRASEPGTYTHTIRVTAFTRMPNASMSEQVYADFVMRLVVTGDAIPGYTFTPAQVSVTRKYGSTTFEATSFSYTTNRPGVWVLSAGVDSYTYPPAAEGYTLTRSWWSGPYPGNNYQYGTRVCSSYVGDTRACLPVGTYTTVMSYDVYDPISQSSSRIAVPVTLTVVP
jgi:hypothetical protein